MIYRNDRTGSVISTNGEISGGDWREIPASDSLTRIDSEKVEVKKKNAKTRKTRVDAK